MPFQLSSKTGVGRQPLERRPPPSPRDISQLVTCRSGSRSARPDAWPASPVPVHKLHQPNQPASLSLADSRNMSQLTTWLLESYTFGTTFFSRQPPAPLHTRRNSSEPIAQQVSLCRAHYALSSSLLSARRLEEASVCVCGRAAAASSKGSHGPNSTHC